MKDMYIKDVDNSLVSIKEIVEFWEKESFFRFFDGGFNVTTGFSINSVEFIVSTKKFPSLSLIHVFEVKEDINVYIFLA